MMYDRQTESLWSHLTGRCIWGPLKGEQLEMVTSVPKIKWQDWKGLHPTTKVLSVEGGKTLAQTTTATTTDLIAQGYLNLVTSMSACTQKIS